MLSKITSVEELIETLDEIDLQEFPKAIKKIEIKPQILEAYATWTTNNYTRNCLARSKKYELILLCWDKHSKTPVHDHGGEDCWVYQISGSVQEIRFNCLKGKLIESNCEKLAPGRLTFMNDKMGFHSIQNDSETRAMTFHIYASPIDSCKIYNNETECFESKVMAYDNVAELESDYAMT